jgi:hypothetical protein
MKYLNLGITDINNKQVFLAMEEIVTPIKEREIKSVNNFFLFDESGSMCYSIHLLCTQLKIKELPLGDTITLGWFSSNGGEFRFIVKGHKLTSDQDFVAIDNIIDKNCRTYGTTCFSEILTDLNQVIDEVTALNPYPNSLIFFTDEYPVPNVSSEIEKVHKALTLISSKIQTSLLVGYGNYYNKTLMIQMADRIGGSLIHSDNLEAFSYRLKNFWENSRDLNAGRPITLPIFGYYPFSISRDFRIRKYEIPNFTYYPVKDQLNYLYYLTTSSKENAGYWEEVQLNENLIKNKDPFIEGLYGLAYSYVQSMKVDSALEVLGLLGDVYLIDLVTNSYTNSEFGRVEAELLHAIGGPAQRLRGGRKLGYLCPEDAFCLKNLIDLLMEDKEVYFYPNDERFEYERIGKKTSYKAGYSKFNRNPTSKSDLIGLTYHSTRLNLSIRVKLDGHIDLDDQAKSFGFESSYPTFIWRNYSLVKDGILNVKSLPLSVSQKTFDFLQEKGCIDKSYSWKDGGIYSVRLDVIPIMNRKMGKGKTSARELAAKAIHEAFLEGDIKVLKYFKNKHTEVVKLSAVDLRPEQRKYLEVMGITSNGYNPPSEKEDSVDYYEARCFDIKLKGLAKLPKVEDVITKLSSGKNFTKVELLMREQILDCLNHEKNLEKIDFLKWLERKITIFSKNLAEVRKEIQETKFAILLGKKWFDEFTSRESGTLFIKDALLGDVEVIFSLETEKVYF